MPVAVARRVRGRARRRCRTARDRAPAGPAVIGGRWRSAAIQNDAGRARRCPAAASARRGRRRSSCEACRTACPSAGGSSAGRRRPAGPARQQTDERRPHRGTSVDRARAQAREERPGRLWLEAGIGRGRWRERTGRARPARSAPASNSGWCRRGSRSAIEHRRDGRKDREQDRDLERRQGERRPGRRAAGRRR